MISLEITLYLVLFIASFLAIGKYDYEKNAKNAHIWTQIPKTLEQSLHFYLNTNFGAYLNTFLDKPKKQFYLR